jgi:hypothetical protein
MIRKDFYIENTRIRIDDAHCVKTREETDGILARIAILAIENINSAAAADEKVQCLP